MIVKIENLTFKAIIGILPIERTQKQQIVVNVSFEYQFIDGNFVDYSCIANYIKKTIKKKRFFLIEDAILYLNKKLIKKYNIKNLHIQIFKPDILDDCIVSVSS